MKASTLNNLPSPIAKSLSDRSAFTNALFTRPESLSALLPYDEFLSLDSLYLLKDGSLGAVYELELLEHEPMISKKIIEEHNGKVWVKSKKGLGSTFSFKIPIEQKKM